MTDTEVQKIIESYKRAQDEIALLQMEVLELADENLCLVIQVQDLEQEIECLLSDVSPTYEVPPPHLA